MQFSSPASRAILPNRCEIDWRSAARAPAWCKSEVPFFASERSLQKIEVAGLALREGGSARLDGTDTSPPVLAA